MAKQQSFDPIRAWAVKHDERRKQEKHEQDMRHADEIHQARLKKISAAPKKPRNGTT